MSPVTIRNQGFTSIEKCYIGELRDYISRRVQSCFLLNNLMPDLSLRRWELLGNRNLYHYIYTRAVVFLWPNIRIDYKM